MIQDFRERDRCASFELQLTCNKRFTIGELAVREFVSDNYAPTYRKGDVVIFGQHVCDQWGSFALVQVCDETGNVFHEVSGILTFSSDWSATVEGLDRQKVTVRCEDFETTETGPLSVVVKTPIKIIRPL